jgi:hypothetical protein
MMSPGTLKLTTRGDREIVLTRVFDAPGRLVFDAFTKPELLRQWLLGASGMVDGCLRAGSKGRRQIPLCLAPRERK